MKTFFLFSFLVLTGLSLSAQQESPKITNQDRIQMQTEAYETVNNFCKALSRLASKELSDAQKESLIEHLLSFFVEDATMDVATIKNGKYIHNEADMEVYLKGIARYRNKYAVVLLTFTAIKVDVNNLKDTTYKGQPAILAKFSFIQKLEVQKSVYNSVSNGEPAVVANLNKPNKITDISSKEGSVIILRRKNRPFENSKKYRALLGDITVDEVRVTKSK